MTLFPFNDHSTNIDRGDKIKYCSKGGTENKEKRAIYNWFSGLTLTHWKVSSTMKIYVVGN